MSTNFDDEKLSQLSDGELGPDEAGAVLLNTLDDEPAREHLKELLQLRLSLATWRGLQPTHEAIAAPASPQAGGNPRAILRKVLPLATAAVLGGLLVLAGVLAARFDGDDGPVNRASGQQANAAVSLEQRRQVAQVFAFHESVAGPLKWYAADADNIQLASAEGTEAAGRPVAVMLHLRTGRTGDSAESRNYVIVCREQRPTTVRLPAYAGKSRLRVFLIPRSHNGAVHIEYAVALEPEDGEAKLAALLGRRDVALRDTALGQLVVDGRLVNVDANAWMIEKEEL